MMKTAAKIALYIVGMVLALCAVAAAGFVATSYADLLFGEPWNFVMGFSFFLLFLFVAVFLIALPDT